MPEEPDPPFDIFGDADYLFGQDDEVKALRDTLGAEILSIKFPQKPEINATAKNSDGETASLARQKPERQMIEFSAEALLKDREKFYAAVAFALNHSVYGARYFIIENRDPGQEAADYQKVSLSGQSYKLIAAPVEA